MLNPEQIIRIKKLTEQGISLYKQEDYSNALKLFEHALDIHPKWIIALQYKCLCQIILAESVEETRQVIPTLVHSVIETEKLLTIIEDRSLIGA